MYYNNTLHCAHIPIGNKRNHVFYFLRFRSMSETIDARRSDVACFARPQTVGADSDLRNEL